MKSQLFAFGIYCFLQLAIWPSESAIQFFHISDLHLDRNYSDNGLYTNRCHPNGTGPGDHLGEYGNYACDPPASLVESALIKMSDVNSSPEFIIWTGDSNPHWFDGPDFPYIFNNLRNLTRLFHIYFNNTLVIPALGNHDTYPADYYKDSTVTPNASNIYYGYLKEGAWADFIQDQQARDTFKKCGFYSYRHTLSTKKTIKFVVLNTNLYYYNNETLDQTDPCGQLSWFESELNAAKSEDQVYVVAHVPPGYFERNVQGAMFNVANGQEYTKRFEEIVTRSDNYKKIVAHFYGHTHTDTFRLFMDEDDVAVGVGFIPGSVTPALYLNHKPYGVNPSFRQYSYDDDNRILLDYEQYYLPLDKVPSNLEQVDQQTSDRRKNSKFLDVSKRQTHPPGNVNDDPQDRVADQTIAPAEGGDQQSDVATTLSPVNDTNDAAGTEQPTKDEAPPEDDTSEVTTSEPEEDNNIAPATTKQPPDSDVEDQDQATEEPDEVVTTEAPPAGSQDRANDVAPSSREARLAQLWTYGYNATSAFEVTDLSVKKMQTVLVSMRSGGPSSTVFKKYFKHNTMFHVLEANQSCDNYCFVSNLCAISNFVNKDMRRCLQKANYSLDPPVSAEPTPVNTEKQEKTGSEALPSPPHSGDPSILEEQPAMENPADALDNNDGEQFSPADPVETPVESLEDDDDDDDSKGNRQPQEKMATPPPLGQAPDLVEVSKANSSGSGTGVILGFLVVILLALIIGGLYVYKRIQRNRYRAQEFLLTDSVFRYDGYSQVDQP